MMTYTNSAIQHPETDEKQIIPLLSRLPHLNSIFLYLFYILIAIWAIGRILEGMSGHTIFEPWLARGIGASAGILALTALLAWGVQSAVSIAGEHRKLNIYPAWLLLLFLALGGIYLLQGYAVAVSGLFAMLTGNTREAELATFALFKFHPGTPILALNLVLLKLLRGSLDVGLMAPFAWKPAILLGFFIWSIILGTSLLFLKGLKGAKLVHLLLALSGTLLIMHFKAHTGHLTNSAVFIHAAGVSLMIFQLLLVYASLRATLPADALSRRQLPRGLVLGLAVVLLIPALTDLYRQNAEISKSQRLAQTLPVKVEQKEQKVILTAPVSVHSGPAYGDTILGKLPARTKVIVKERKYGWVRIGPNRWIEDTYLTPIKSAVQSATMHQTNRSRS
jgi:hypothetical protein